MHATGADVHSPVNHLVIIKYKVKAFNSDFVRISQTLIGNLKSAPSKHYPLTFTTNLVTYFLVKNRQMTS